MIRMGRTGVALAVAGLAAAAGAGSPAAAVLAIGAGSRAAADAGLSGYQEQRIAWHGCQREAADPTGEELDRAGARCAEVTVPLDYTRPDGATITVAISRLPASDTAGRIGALLLNTGGPGAPGIGDILPVRDWMGDVGSRFDLIGMDPRFVGRSTPLDCGWPVGVWNRSAGPDRAGFDAIAAFERDLAARCAQRYADVLPYVTTRNTARDMDLIRAVLGEPRLSYLGYSYGTYLGAVYTQLFPGHAGRVVLDSAVDPAKYGPMLLHDTGPANERALRDWAAWTARHDDRYGLGRTADQVLAAVDRVYLAATRHPLRVGDYRVDGHLVPFLLFNRLGDDRDESQADLASTVRVLATAVDGTPAEPTPSLEETLAFALTGAQSQSGSVQAAILCGDVAAPRDPDDYWRDIRSSRGSEPVFGPFVRNISPCAFWPYPPREPPTRVHNGVPALIVQSTGDTRTPYPGGEAMHRALAGSRLLTLRGARIHAVYGNYGDSCVDGVVNSYLRDGALPGADLDCQRSGPSAS